MQVGSIAAPLSAVPYVRVSGSLAPPAYAAGLSSMSPGTRVALNQIASSSRLSGTEKRTFIRLLAEIDQYANGDPKLILKVMMMVAMAESLRAQGEYRTHAQAEVDQMYWEARQSMAATQKADAFAELPLPTSSALQQDGQAPGGVGYNMLA